MSLFFSSKEDSSHSINYWCAAVSDRAGGYFFVRAGRIVGGFEGFFGGAKTFLGPKLSRAQQGAALGSEGSRPPRGTPKVCRLCVLPGSDITNC